MEPEIEIRPPCSHWEPGDSTAFPPDDAAFLRQVVESGFVAFTGPSGLFGRSETGAVVVIHRGRGRNWEVVFREADADVFATVTSALSIAGRLAISWLMNEPIDNVRRSQVD